MADQLATPADLASALQQNLDASTANLWLDVCTAVVQAAADNQRIVEVVGATLTVMGLTSPWLALPQIPVTAVASVTLDGTALTAVAPGGAITGYRRVGNKLWRTAGWQTYVGEPSEVTVVCTHGFPAASQDLQLGRGAVISIAKLAYANVSGVKSEKIDDYAVVYEAAAAAMEASPHLSKALAKKYGRRGGLVRLG